VGKTLGQRRLRFRKLKDLSKKARAATLSFCGVDFVASPAIPDETVVMVARPPAPPEIRRWHDPATMSTVLQMRGLGDVREVRFGPSLADINRQVFEHINLWQAEIERAMLGGTVNAPHTALTAEMIRQSVAQLRADPRGTPEDNERQMIGRYLPFAPLRGIDPDVNALLFGRYEGVRNRLRVATALSRIDPETAARSRERARGLLKSLLTPEQWGEFEAGGAVTERIDGCEFKLTPGGMIEAKKPRLVGRPVVERWCISPDPYADKNEFMPDEDKLIGQLLHLRAGPDQLRRQANVYPDFHI
jgi:hypothetical protein